MGIVSVRGFIINIYIYPDFLYSRDNWQLSALVSIPNRFNILQYNDIVTQFIYILINWLFAPFYFIFHQIGYISPEKGVPVLQFINVWTISVWQLYGIICYPLLCLQKQLQPSSMLFNSIGSHQIIKNECEYTYGLITIKRFRWLYMFSKYILFYSAGGNAVDILFYWAWLISTSLKYKYICIYIHSYIKEANNFNISSVFILIN